MAIRVQLTWQKLEGNFNSADEARDDLRQFYPEEQRQANDAWHDQMVADGTLRKPMERIWNPENKTLTYIREINDIDAYDASKPYEISDVDVYVAQAGWVQIDFDRTEI